MNKITKLLFAFVTIASFSLASCEPDYVTDGSTVPSEAQFTVTYYDSQGNVTRTEQYNYDKTNAQVMGQRNPAQDGATGESYTASRFAMSPFENAISQNAPTRNPSIIISIDFQEPGNYEISNVGRDRATISFGEGKLFSSSSRGGHIEVQDYTILEASVSDMYFRSRANFSFDAVNSTTSERCKVEGTLTSNFKL